MSNEKHIRFIDSNYKALFTVPDGANIVLTRENGETFTRQCKHIDDYHAQIGSNVYHICEFAERMERNGTSYVPEKPLTLPDKCFSTLPSSGELIRIDKGTVGYTKVPYSTANPRENRKMATQMNEERGVFPQQEAAMLAGSMFGWYTPAARLSSYNMHGEPIKPMIEEQSRESIDYMEAGELKEKERESSFLNNPTDAYAIYQLKHMEETRDLRYEPLECVQAAGMTVDRTNYKLVYTAPLEEAEEYGLTDHLNALYEQFNISHPVDFEGNSLSISDVVALKQNGEVSFHYVDRFGFAELPDFLPPDNPLKNVDMALEDDYGMIDGVINNGKAPAATISDSENKPSEKQPTVLEQFKADKASMRAQPWHESKPPVKSAGIER